MSSSGAASMASCSRPSTFETSIDHNPYADREGREEALAGGLQPPGEPILTSVPPGLRWLPLPLIVTTFVGFSVGLATIPLSLIGEILLAREKSKAMSQPKIIF